MRIFVIVWSLIVILASSALAQHADVRPYVENGQIKTGGFNDATSDFAPGLRAFGYDFGEDPSQPYFTQDPGFNAASSSGLPSASQLIFNIVGSATLGLPANLSYWNGVGPVTFATTPAAETLTLNFGSQNVLVDNSTSSVAGFSLQTVTASGAVHRHLNAFLNAPTDPTPGIYLLPLELQSSDLSLATSTPFFIVYNNGMSETVHDAAISWVQDNLVVPEPNAGLHFLIFASVCGICRTRRRKLTKQRV